MKFKVYILVSLFIVSGMASASADPMKSIAKNCKSKWRGNIQLNRDCIKRQKKALKSIQTKARFFDAELIQRCQKKWKTDFELVNYCIDKRISEQRKGLRKGEK